MFLPWYAIGFSTNYFRFSLFSAVFALSGSNLTAFTVYASISKCLPIVDLARDILMSFWILIEIYDSVMLGFSSTYLQKASLCWEVTFDFKSPPRVSFLSHSLIQRWAVGCGTPRSTAKVLQSVPTLLFVEKFFFVLKYKFLNLFLFKINYFTKLFGTFSS